MQSGTSILTTSDILGALRTAWAARRLVVERSLTGESAGKSGAAVALVDVEIDHPRHSGLAVLKIEQKNQWGEPSEHARHIKARALSADFSRIIPEVIVRHETGEWDATLYNVVEGGLRFTNTLKHVSPHSSSVFQSISDQLLSKWNCKSKLSEEAFTPEQVLKEWLGYRLSDMSGLVPFIRNEFGVSATDSLWWIFRDKFLPNPLSFATKERYDWKLRAHRFLRGAIHGDAHSGNFLVPPTRNKFFVIDFGLARENSLILYDHAYLEIDILLNSFLEPATPERLLDLLEFIDSWSENGIGESAFPLSQVSISSHEEVALSAVSQIRMGVKLWMRRSMLSARESVERQYRLALVAVGLNWANKQSLSEKTRRLSLLWAAHSAHCYLKLENDARKPSLPDATKIDESHKPGVGRADILHELRHFDPSAQTHWLIVSADSFATQTNASLSGLALAHWSLIIDFGAELIPGDVVRNFRIALARPHRPVHYLVPNDQVDVGFMSSTVWLSACGMPSRPSSRITDFRTWQRKYAPLVREWIRLAVAEQSARPIFVVVAGDPRSNGFVNWLFEAGIEAGLDPATFLFLGIDPAAKPVGARLLNATLDEVGSAATYIFGTAISTNEIWLPSRDGGQRQISDDDFNYVCEDLELVVRAAVDFTQSLVTNQDFYHGNPPSWNDIELHRDIDRDVSPELNATVLEALKAHRTMTIPFPHTPGAGATTVARRILFSFANSYPCAILKRLSEQTADRLGLLTQQLGLPVLVLIDRNVLSQEGRERLYQQTRTNQTKVVLLHLYRQIKPPIGRSSMHLVGPMSFDESKRFANEFSRATPEKGRQKLINDLATKPALARYRLPFFFGLYAFGKDFHGVSAFVREHIDNEILSQDGSSARILCHVALTTLYSQNGIEIDLIRRMAGGENNNRTSTLQSIFGESTLQLLIIEAHQQIRAIHPVIAEEIVDCLLLDRGRLRENLSKLSIDLIEDFEKLKPTPNALLEILSQMFVTREPWTEESHDSGFSRLIGDINDQVLERSTMKALTESFPGESHFWNHRGRHSSRRAVEAFSITKGYFERAIELAPADPLHHHALGMACRREQYRLARNFLNEAREKPGDQSSELLEIVEEVHSAAREAFLHSKELAPDSEYSYVTNIQMLAEILRDLKRASKIESSSVFLENSSVSKFVSEAISLAMDNLETLESLRLGDPSKMMLDCEARLENIIGSAQSTIQAYEKLLANPSSNKQNARSAIARTMMFDVRRQWDKLSIDRIRRIRDLMSENLVSGSALSEADIRMWFQASRRLPDFDVEEALVTLKRWDAISKNVDAKFYIYVLEFLRWFNGDSLDTRELDKCIRECRDRAQTSPFRAQSLEWFGTSQTANKVVHRSELGNWDEDRRFFANVSMLRTVEGVVTRIDSPTKGEIEVLSPNRDERLASSLRIFFQPKGNFLQGRDNNRPVQFYLAFTYDGLHAWEVQRKG